MAILPLRPYLKSYRESKENLHRKTAEYNAMAQRIVDHLNTLIANDPNEMQSYLYGFIAHDLGLTPAQICLAVRDGGNNGITLRVTEDDRRELARYKSSNPR